MHQIGIGPALCALPVQDKSKQLLIWFDILFDDLNFWETCQVPLVEGLFLINECNSLLSLVEKFLNYSDIRNILV